MMMMKGTSADGQLRLLVSNSHWDHCTRLKLLVAPSVNTQRVMGQGFVGELLLLVLPKVCWAGAVAVFPNLGSISPHVTMCVSRDTGFVVFVIRDLWIRVPCFSPVPPL